MERKLRRTASWPWSSWISLWRFREVKCGQQNLDYSVRVSQLLSFKVKKPTSPLDLRLFKKCTNLKNNATMNKDMSELFKVLITNFGDNLKKQPSRADGLSPGLLRGRFKKELRNSVCFALLKGNALAAYDQGTQRVSHTP